MTVEDLIVDLERFRKEYPGRKLPVHARHGYIAIEVQTGGKPAGPVTEQTGDLGRGTGSRWLTILVPEQ